MPNLFEEYDLKKKKKENIQVEDDIYNTYIVVDKHTESLNVYPFGNGKFFKVDNNDEVEILTKDKFDEELKKEASLKIIRAKVAKKLRRTAIK